MASLLAPSPTWRRCILLIVCIFFMSVTAAKDSDLTRDEILALPAKKVKSLGDNYLMKKDYEKALDMFTIVIDKEPDNEKNYYKRVKVYEKMKNYKKALQDLNRALEINPEYTSALGLRGRLYMNLGQCNEAAKDYQAVLKIKPTHGDAKKQLPKALEGAKQVSEVERLIGRGIWEEAERKLDEVIDFLGKVSHLLYLRARARYELGKHYEAVADLGVLLKKEKNDVDALLLRGRAYYRVGEHDMAQRHIREILKYDPEHEETKQFYRTLKALVKHVEDGDVALKKATHEGLLEAIEQYENAVQIDSSNTDFLKHVYVKLCKCYAKLKQKQEAKQACDLAKQIDNSLVEAYTIYAEMLLKMADTTEEYEQVVRVYHEAAEHHGQNNQVRDGLRRAEVALKQSKQKNYYKILGVPRDAESGAIKKAYRKKAKELHPDRHQDKGEEELKQMEIKFQEVAEAYEVLSDDEKRGKYDRGEEVFENQGGGQRRHPHGFPFNFGGGQPRGGHQQFHFNF
uniref:J domain-containing protein n=1 Tax=Aplanochytrium stocchinoi TaxID=215587 RepID=A0A7S3PH13_9STRA|mmetsp:Transcript_1459/g.1936  ORF Transcript_1459/g.1936 Transcript_1459/m.1936 type:complete len:513 (+) Transcript_1459:194-1732(+)